jgi:hypothetical protein
MSYLKLPVTSLGFFALYLFARQSAFRLPSAQEVGWQAHQLRNIYLHGLPPELTGNPLAFSRICLCSTASL